jgi:hypothetical protein
VETGKRLQRHDLDWNVYGSGLTANFWFRSIKLQVLLTETYSGNVFELHSIAAHSASLLQHKPRSHNRHVWRHSPCIMTRAPRSMDNTHGSAWNSTYSIHVFRFLLHVPAIANLQPKRTATGVFLPENGCLCFFKLPVIRIKITYLRTLRICTWHFNSLVILMGTI